MIVCAPKRGSLPIAPGALVGALLAALVTAGARGELRWEPTPDLPVGVFDAAAVRSGAAVVVVGGIDAAGRCSALAQRLDLDTMTWEAVLRLRQGRAFHAAVTLRHGRILVAGGRGGAVGRLSPLASCELIDPAAGTVEPVAPLPRPMDEPTAHVLPDGRVIVVGGRRAAILETDLNAWSTLIQLRQERSAHASILLPDGRVLVVGGVNATLLELIDPTERQSLGLAAQLPVALDDLRLALLADGRVWVLGGQTSPGDTTDQTWIVDLSDPRRATLEAGPALAIEAGMADHVSESVAHWVVLAGGESQRSGRDTEKRTARLLDRRSLEVWSLPDLPTVHDDAASVALDDGVLVVGGYRVSVRGGLPLPTAGREVWRLRLPPEALR